MSPATSTWVCAVRYTDAVPWSAAIAAATAAGSAGFPGFPAFPGSGPPGPQQSAMESEASQRASQVLPSDVARKG
ncbi:hypothetical protein ABZY16_23715, partial [Streptomyces sp. NPDC006553]